MQSPSINCNRNCSEKMTPRPVINKKMQFITVVSESEKSLFFCLCIAERLLWPAEWETKSNAFCMSHLYMNANKNHFSSTDILTHALLFSDALRTLFLADEKCRVDFSHQLLIGCVDVRKDCFSVNCKCNHD